MGKALRCGNCGAPQISPEDKFCHRCGARLRKERSKTANFFITLLACLGFYAVYFGITLLVETVHELLIMRDMPGFPRVDEAELYSKLSERFCEFSILSAVIVLLVFFIIFAARKKKISEEVRLYTVPPLKLTGLFVLGVTAQFVVTVFLTVLYALRPDLYDYSASDRFELLLRNANPVVEFIYIAVITPLLEETLFRGIIFTRLKKIMPTAPAVIISAVIFGAAHGNAEQFVYASLLGLLLAAAFNKFDSLWASFIIHVAFNASSYSLEYLPNDPAVFTAAFFLAAGVFAAVFAYTFLMKKQPIKAGKDNEAL